MTIATLNRAQRRAAGKSAGKQQCRRPSADPLAAMRALSHTRAAQSTEALDASQVRDLSIGYHGALHSIISGTGSWNDANTLALAVNIALLLVEAGLGIDQLKTVQDGQASIMAMVKRQEQIGRYVLTGPELRHLQDVLELHDAQISDRDCTESVMVAALAECKRLMMAGSVLS
jgi:hypothetical protein